MFNSHLSRARSFGWALALSLCVSAPSARAQDAAAPPGDSWTMLSGDPQRSGSSPAKVTLPLSLGWRHSSDGAAGTFRGSPLVLGAPGQQRIYFAAGRDLLCLDAQTGATVAGWKKPIFESAVVAPLAALSTEEGDLIIAAGASGKVGAYRAIDGGQVWQTQVPGGVSSGSPIFVQTPGGPRIVVATDAGTLSAISTKGELDPKWSVSLGRFGNPPSSALALSQNGQTLYLAATDGRLFAIDVKNAKIAWSVNLPSPSSITPVVGNRSVFMASFGRLTAYEGSGGARSWNVLTRGTVSAAPAFRVVDGIPTVFYGTTEGTFAAVNAIDGTSRWRTNTGLSLTSAPVVLDNMVLVGTNSGSLVALNPKNGAILWRYRLGTERLQRPTGAGQGGFTRVQQNDGGVGGNNNDQNDGANNADPGTDAGTENTGRFSSPYALTAPPAVVNGQIFVQGDNAAIYAFTSQAIDADVPRVVEPSIAVPDEAGNLAALLVGGENVPVVPGRGPFYFAATLDDVGSGIDVSSVQASLDGTALTPKDVEFDPASGVLTLTLMDGVRTVTSFPDGNKTLSLRVRDYAGNTFSSDFAFSIDNSAPPPRAAILPVPGGGNAPEGGNPAPGGGDNDGNNGPQF